MRKTPERFGLEIQAGVVIPRTELEVRATKSGGPGGQHVNTSSTRVELLWTLGTSLAVTDEQRERIRARLAPRLDADGKVRVVSSDTRSQKQNRALAEERLVALVRRALVIPKKRRQTAPTKGSVERRLAEKHIRSQRKRERRLTDSE